MLITCWIYNLLKKRRWALKVILVSGL